MFIDYIKPVCVNCISKIVLSRTLNVYINFFHQTIPVDCSKKPTKCDLLYVLNDAYIQAEKTYSC